MMTSTIWIILILQTIALVGILIKLFALNNKDKSFQSLLTREDALKEGGRNRAEFQQSIQQYNEGVLSRMTDISTLQKNQLDSLAKQLTNLTQGNLQHMEKIRETVDKKMTSLQEDNSKKLEQMRVTVDEKLHATLEKRLGESFKLVSERLELVHKGLGEMQHLAHGVGDLKKVLTNVKTRGTWGEIQLESLLEQLLTQDQYEKNVRTKASSAAHVEFAIKLPGKSEDDSPIWLPIDAKFPQEPYQRLIEAQEQGSSEDVELASKQLETQLKLEAKKINEKYLDPPNTTDFGILFLPTEGLYAEALRLRGIAEMIQSKHRILLAGPTNLTALLNSLQMGFRTLAIEKRSSEVWTLLSAVKTEFSKFGDILDKTQKKLQEAGNTIETAARKSRTIERKLRSVEELPTNEKHTIAPVIKIEETEALSFTEFE